ncbi:hypothetical protein ACFL0C_01520 [Patescibacteria group bacterium]
MTKQGGNSLIIVLVLASILTIVGVIIYLQKNRNTFPINNAITNIIPNENIEAKPSEESKTPYTDIEPVKKEKPKSILATKNTLIASDINFVPLFSVVVPNGTHYYEYYGSVNIETDSGLTVVLCTTCQLFVPNCGGLSDGNEEEGGCAIQTVPVGNDLTIGKYYRSIQPNVIYGYYDNYTNSNGDYVGVRVTSSNNRTLTLEDQDILNTIIKSID